ncbi:uncharacterized protein LOC123530040 [Mercenaria mercenaria]|uniref:uncharacterized protein LOC123530040 n=1 Tax=Mercenaria mercenaria TaxID=6596 RepID=UPI00234EAE8C|nr:uncharacterized protein LOC123530040 [Mercenaria mercenaria]
MSRLYKLFVVSLLAGLVGAIKPCCVSKKWTGKLRITTASVASGSTIPVISENVLMFDYDHDMKMEKAVGRIVTYNGSMETTQEYTVYNDYRHMRKYAMTPDSNACHIQPLLGEQTEPCVPSTLKWAGNYTLGSTSEGVHVNAWSGDYENSHYEMLTTVNDCTPVEMTVFGTMPDGTRVSTQTVFVDVTQYMTSPGALNIPDMCKTGGAPIGK